MIKMESKLHIRQVMSCLLMLAVCIPLAAKKNYDFKVDGLYYKIIGDGKVEVTYEKKDSEKNYKDLSEVSVPAEVVYKDKKYLVEKIGERAFHKSPIASIALPEGIGEIGPYAFRSCYNLTSISLPFGLKSIGDFAFYSCRNLSTILMPDCIRTIGEYGFSYCNKLQEVKLPAMLTKISRGLFSYSGIKQLDVPINVNEIGSWAFYYSDLESISLPEGLKRINGRSFSECENLKEIYLPDGVEFIEDYTFTDTPARISCYYKTKFEWRKPDNLEGRRYTMAELAEQQRRKEEREAEKIRQQQAIEAEKQRADAFRKPIRWAANVSEAKKAIIQAEYDDMVFIDEGKFEMGAKKGYKVDVKGHTVSLSPYLIGKNSVSQELWSAVMGYNPSQNPSDNGPVDNVSWNDCMEFITKLRQMTGIEFRLPTEAQWEYAAKGGAKSKGYYYAGTSDPNKLYRKDKSGVMHNIPNELGLYGMSGGVYEWCADWFGPYSDVEVKNPTGPASGNGRVMRSGGGTINYGGNIKQVTDRNWGGQAYRSGQTGLRLAVSPKLKEEKFLTPEQQARLQHPLLKKVVWAKGLSADRKEIIADAIADMVKVDGGTYTFRGKINEYVPSNIPYGKEVKVRPFYINKFEVTNKLWDAVFPGYDTAYRPKTGHARQPGEAVCNVDPDEIARFIQQLNRLTGLRFALPTEAQWEFAARGGNASMGYAYAGTNDKSKVDNYAKTKIANELGLYDMTSGVWELLSDKPYSEGLKMRVDIWRGGPETIYDRWKTTYISHDHNLGFRLVLNIAPATGKKTAQKKSVRKR